MGEGDAAFLSQSSAMSVCWGLAQDSSPCSKRKTTSSLMVCMGGSSLPGHSENHRVFGTVSL